LTPVEGMTATVMTRLPSARRQDGRVVNATDPALLTEAELAGRRQALEYVRFLVDRVPGYERARLAALSTQVGVRETRRGHGDARLTADDVLSARPLDDPPPPPPAPPPSPPPASSTTRSACAGRRSRTTTPARAPAGGTCPTGRSSA